MDFSVFRLADRWRDAARAIESNRRSFADIEDAYLADRHHPVREAAFRAAARRQEVLFDRLAATRTMLYGSTPTTPKEAVVLLKVVRDAEEDVFEDEELATAIDSVISALLSR